MSARAHLERYLAALRRRLRTLIYTRAAATAAATILILTCAAVWLLQQEGYPAQLAWIGRGVLVLAAAAIAVVLLWRPLRALRRENGAMELERLLPEQQGRVRTYLDGVRREQADGVRSPLLDLLAEDAATRADRRSLHEVISQRRMVVAAGIAAGALLILVLLAGFGPDYWGYGSRHLLFGASLPKEAIPVRRVVVQPGDATVRRNSDFTVTASVQGFDPDRTEIFVRFADDQEWQRAPMQVADGQGNWQFKLFALRAPLQYYVTADNIRSSEHNVAVIDLPRIKSVRLTYEYPEWTGLEPAQEEEARDIRAVAGTKVQVTVVADAPLESPTLIVDGNAGAMQGDGVNSSGVIAVEKEGRYHIGARVANELVALTDEYFIDIVSDEKPTIEIVKPGRDWRATSIEEVPVRIQAQDDFRLQRVELRYTVNGGEWKTLPIDGAGKQTDAESLLRLEELGTLKKAAGEVQESLEPGDLVSYYAVAKDREQTVQTDLFMVQVQPFERRFMQGQGGGGGGSGGMGDEQGEISDRQREILLATWNLQRSDARNSRSREQLEDNAKMLAELQSTLAQQARTLATRTRARVALEQDPGMKQFVESLERAAALMDPAARHLDDFKLEQAVPVEQQALQQVLRAESAFRDVQVSMQRSGGAGGGAQAARNLTEMFELEMDLDKNQYETESQVSMENSQEELNDAIRKLKQLAERQEKLAQEANRSALSMEEQRWRQEQLRREAEDLKRRLAELARNERNAQQNAQANAQNSSSQSGQPSSQSGAQQGRQSGSGQSSGSQRSGPVANALESLQRALEQMRAANSAQQQTPDQQQTPPSGAANAQRNGPEAHDANSRSAREASRNLRRALDQIDRPTEDNGLAQTLEELARRTQRLAGDQHRIESDLNDAIAAAQRNSTRATDQGAIDARQAESLVEAKQRMAEDLSNLQSDMRAAAQQHRKRAPETTQRLGEVISELDASNVMYRINRSAAEIFYRRAREAAAREGLISEALENLEQQLRETATLAARERNETRQGVDAEELLAELGELRRAVQEAQNRQAASAQRNGDAPGQGERSGTGEPSRQPGEGSQQGESRNGDDSQPGTSGSRTAANGGANSNDGAGGWRAWNPAGPVGPRWNGGGTPWRDTQQLGERVQSFVDRLNPRELTQAEIDRLRRMAQQLRRLSGDPMSAQPEAMMRLIDQIELATLAAAARSKGEVSPHATVPSTDSPQYRETVAEYYRRLGGGT